MSAAFDKAFAFTERPDVEGGFANVAGDRGGRTGTGGLTQKLYDAWRQRHGMTTQDVTLASDEERRAVFFEEFWVPCRCEELPAGLGAAVFDMAVNSGPLNARITLQEAISVRQDGVIGPATIAAAAGAIDPVLKFLKKRAAFYRDIVVEDTTRLQAMFLEGWIVRLLNFQDAFYKGAFA